MAHGDSGCAIYSPSEVFCANRGILRQIPFFKICLVWKIVVTSLIYRIIYLRACVRIFQDVSQI